MDEKGQMKKLRPGEVLEVRQRRKSSVGVDVRRGRLVLDTLLAKADADMRS